jgi:hypothetical protein
MVRADVRRHYSGFRASDLPDFKLYIRTLFRGRPQEPFLVQSFPPFTKNGKETTAEQVIRTSGARFGRDRLTVEKTVERLLAPRIGIVEKHVAAGRLNQENTWQGRKSRPIS